MKNNITRFIIVITLFLSLFIFNQSSSTLGNDRVSPIKLNSFNKEAELANDDIVLSELGGSETNLVNPTIDKTKNKITYEISLDEFMPGQISAKYTISKAIVSEEAIVAATILDYSLQTEINYFLKINEFREKLLEKKAGNNDVNPTIAINLALYYLIKKETVPIYMGSFSIYSQASMIDDKYMNEEYINTYDIYLKIKPRIKYATGNIHERYINLDGTYYNFNSFKNKKINVDYEIGIAFRDNNNILPQNYDIRNNISLYYNNEKVDSDYYELSTVPINNRGEFLFDIEFSERLRSGEYILKYKYCTYSQEYRLRFNKTTEVQQDLKVIKDGEVIVADSNNTFYTNIPYGENLDVHNIAYQQINDNDPSYSYMNTYNINFSDDIKVKTTGNLIKLDYLYTIYSNGYKSYVFEYTVEINNEQTKYVHIISEEIIEIQKAYKNDILLDNHNFNSDREEDDVFKFDLSISKEFFNLANLSFKINNENDLPQGISYEITDYLIISLNKETLPGTYIFTIKIYRDGYSIDFAIQIIKNKGKIAYLNNISLSNFESYGKIYESDNKGNIITNSLYQMMLYENKIEYDGASENNINNFKINFYVDKLNESYYLPNMLEYLPIGATISRLDVNGWTAEVEQNENGSDVNRLYGNYLNNNLVVYRVTSEDGNQKIYYHISITDKIYNVYLDFNIYYEEDDKVYNAYEVEELKTILIFIKNFDTDTSVGTKPVEGVEDFLDFNEIIQINNDSMQFYVPHGEQSRYRMGPNLSGFYSINFEISNDYSYRIEYNDIELNDMNSYIDGEKGKYFYIESNVEARYKTFDVYIYRIDNEQSSWGLNNNFESWK